MSSSRLLAPLAAVLALLAPGVALADTPGVLEPVPAPTADAAAVAAPDRVIVRFEADATAAEQRAALADVDGEVARTLPIPQTRVVALPAGTSPEAAAADLRDEEGVRWAQPDYVVSVAAVPNDPHWSLLWGLPKISAPQAWDLATGTSSTVVGVADTGIDAGHADLASSIVAGFDWVENDATPQDLHGHGTHVSGTIAGIGNNGVGVAGVSWRASIMPLRVLNQNGQGYTSHIAAAFAWAGQRGARVVSASLGGRGYDPALRDAIAANPNTLYVLAAGNDGTNNDATGTWPCNVNLANSLCIAATDQNDNLASFSNYGATTVQLAAPGVSILSTARGGGYAYMSGTSMATPHVAGAAALLFSAKPLATVSAVRQALLDSADRLPQLAGKVSSGGRLNVSAALRALGASPAPVATTTPAAQVTTSAATLGGTVDPREQATTWYVEYGPTTAYGRRTADAAVSGSGARAVSVAVTGLESGQTFHFRVVATSPGGTARGDDLTFATTASPPDATTGAASDVTWRGATIDAVANAQGQAATWRLEYGPTTAYGSQTADAALAAGSWSPQALRTTLTTLRPATTYHYRLVVTTAAGTATGADRTFASAALPAPLATTGAASTVGGTEAELAGSVDGGGAPVRYVFQWGPTPAYGDATPAVRLEAALGARPVTAAIGGLRPDTVYHYRLVALTAAGARAGEDRTFSTSRAPGARAEQPVAGAVSVEGPDALAAAAPTVPAVASAGFLTRQTTADALAFVTAGGAAASVWVEYGPTAAYGGRTASAAVDASAREALVGVPLSGLAAGATLHARVVVETAAGRRSTPDETFTLDGPGPEADTAVAHALGATSADVDALVDGLGVATTYRFEYGPTADYGQATAWGLAGAGSGPELVTARLDGLAPATTYHVRVVASSARGTAYGADSTFATATAGPAVTTDAPSRVRATTATVAGALNPGGQRTVYRFEYGPTTAYGAATADAVAGTDAAFRAVRAPLEGLQPGTTYHVRLVAESAAGRATGADVAFTTPAAGVRAEIHPASDVGSTNVRLGGWVDPAGTDTAYAFEYGPTTAYGQRTPVVLLEGAAGEQWVAAAVTGLTPGRTYHARLVAGPADAAVSADVAFVTAPAGPTLGLVSPAAVGSTGARLDLELDANGEATTYRVEYGVDEGYGAVSAEAEGGSAAAYVAHTAALTGLEPATTYHYRVVATNASGVARSADGTFTTASAGPTVGPANVLFPAAHTGEVAVVVDPNGEATSVRVEYGPTTAYGRASETVELAATRGDEPLAIALAGLTSSTEHHLRVVAVNASGTASSEDATFTTDGAGPTPVTGEAIVAGRSATLAGLVNPNGATARYRFEYGRTAAYGTATPWVALEAGEAFVDAAAEVTGLLADTDYHVRVVAEGPGGTRQGDDETFTTDTPGPTPTTGAATGVTGYAATVAGSVNPNGQATVWRVEYGPTTAYGQTTTAQGLVASFATSAVGVALPGLLPGRLYHYRLVAQNASGTKTGDDATLQTAALAPDATTGAASAIGTRGATVTVQVNPHGDATSYRVEYGPTTAYSAQTPAADAGAGTAAATLTRTLSGLTPGTTYHYRVVATNGSGPTVGADRTFTTAPLLAPGVASASAGDVTRTGATVRAVVDPREQATSVRVEYGPTTAYGQASLAVNAGSGSGGVAFETALAGLVPGTTYHYRVVATNATGSAASADATLATTQLPAPSAGLPVASGVTRTGATVAGTVDPNGLATTWWFEYGPTAALGSRTAERATTGTDVGEEAVAALAGLQPDTTYHVRLVARNATGTTRSDEVVLTTAPLPAPDVTGTTATAAGRTALALGGTVNPNGLATTVRFEWGTTTAYGTSTPDVAVGNGTAAQAPTATLTGLTPGTVYHVRLVAQNATGTTRSADVAVTTAPAVDPTATSGAATALTRVSATLAGTVDGRDLPATARFEWGADTQYGTLTPAVATGSGSTAVTAGLVGLAPGTTYHYRVVATTAQGTARGADRTFTTSPAVAPAATTGAASGLAPRSATVAGALDGYDLAATYRFEHGPTTAYGSTTEAVLLPAAGGARTVTATLEGLQASSTVHYRLVVTTDAGTTRGADRSLTTPALPAPTVATLAADALTPSGARFNATVDPAGLATTYAFEWGTGATYGRRTADVALAASAGRTTVSVAVEGLGARSRYHYRIVATNATGTSVGEDVELTTPPGPPAVLTNPADGVTRTTARLNGSLDAGGVPVSYRFEWGPTTAYGASTPAVAGVDGQAAAAGLDGLVPGTVYHYRLVATSSAGTTAGGDVAFTTAAPVPPTAGPDAIADLGPRSVTVSGFVNGRGLPVSYRFEYGPTLSYGSRTDAVELPAGTADRAVSTALGGLTPSTTYHVRLVATSTAGTVNGADMAFTTAALPAPDVASRPATGVTQTAATLAGLVNPNGVATTYRFEWGTTPGYGSLTPSVAAGAGTTDTAIGAVLSGLQAGTTYHYRVYASSASGVTRSADATFTTLAPPPPSGVTGAASAITRTTATVAGTVNPSGSATSSRFEYGTTTGYGSSTPATSAGSGTSAVAAMASLGGLAPGTLYHYRLVATSANGSATGADRTFTTAAATPPAVTTGAASGVGRGSATIAGAVNPNGLATSARFEWGPTTAYGSAGATTLVGSGTSGVDQSATLTGLAPGTTYHYRLVAGNADGTSAGVDRTFTTAPNVVPVATTGGSSAVTRTAATLAGSVDPSAQATSYRFEYGPTTAYGASTPAATLAAGAGTTAVSAVLPDELAPGTRYHYRLVAENATGAAAGADATFTTAVPVPPSATTGVASAAGEFGARLTGTVNPNASATTTWFEYGPDTAYGSRTAESGELTGTGAQPAAASLTELAPGTTYHARLVARNAAGTTYGADVMVRTASAAPATATTAPATAVAIRAAMLNGTLTAGTYGVSYRFEWGTTTAYGQATPAATVAAGTASQAVSAALSGLEPKTVYHARLVVENDLGTVRGADVAFTTQPLPAPSLAYAPATAISTTAATLNGAATPNGLATTARFEWGTTTAYGASTPVQALGSGTGSQALSAALAGLEPGTLYHYRLVATNETGTTVGADQTLTTLRPAPVAQTGTSSAVGPTQATLAATVNPNGLATGVRFEYGPTTAYGSQTAVAAAGSGTAARAMTAALTGLSAHTVYHYRVVASNSTGTTYGADGTFETEWFAAPVATTDEPSAVGLASVTLRGRTNPNGARTTWRFEYGPTAAYGASTPARVAGDGVGLVAVATELGGLTAGTEYHARLVATNETGTTVGADVTFRTAENVAPVAHSPAATGVTAVAATLGARVNANDAPTTYRFEWGPTTAYGAVTPDAAASGHALTAVSAALSGLAPGTTYHFRVVATSAGGTTASPDASFTTPAIATADAAAPLVKVSPPVCAAAVKGRACAAFLGSAKAWKTLKGTTADAGSGASGVALVEVSLLRRLAAGKCVVYTGDAYRQQPCAKADDLWVDAALNGTSWRLALRSLPEGTYALRVRATDRAGNVVSTFKSGQNGLTLKIG